MEETIGGVGFGARLKLALRILFDPRFAAQIAPPPKVAAQKAEKVPAPGEGPTLAFLSALQREGRFIDFIQQEVAGFSDEDIGAGARVVHAGCRKLLREWFILEPALPQPEGTPITVPAGFDAQRIRVTGNVTGQPPFRGVLKHQGWVAKGVHLPSPNPKLDVLILAAAEVELA